MVFEERVADLRELDGAANAAGAAPAASWASGPEVRVGVCAERSLEMVVALLAVLKAGGAPDE